MGLKPVYAYKPSPVDRIDVRSRVSLVPPNSFPVRCWVVLDEDELRSPIVLVQGEDRAPVQLQYDELRRRVNSHGQLVRVDPRAVKGIEVKLPTKPLKPLPVKVAKPVKKVMPEIFKQGSTKINWYSVIPILASELSQIWTSRGMQPNPCAWFSEKNVGKVLKLQSFVGSKNLCIHALRGLFSAYRPELVSDEEVLLMAGRLQARLVCRDSDVRVFFGRTHVGKMWNNAILNLVNSNTCGFHLDWNATIGILDTCHQIIWARTRRESAVLLQCEKVSGGPLGWNFAPLALLLREANAHKVSWKGLLLSLIERETQAARTAFHPRTTRYGLTDLTFHLHALTAQDWAAIPKVDEEWKVYTMIALGIPGGCKIPDRLQFGLECRLLDRADMRLTALTPEGQAIYQDPKGKVYSEGMTCPMQPAVVGWGKGVRIFLTGENVATLLPAWYAPPALCPWAWYAQWGTGDYKADGKAVYPDPKYRPPVTWLEQAG